MSLHNAMITTSHFDLIVNQEREIVMERERERERETERSLHHQVGLCALWFTFLCSENAEVYYSILKNTEVY